MCIHTLYHISKKNQLEVINKFKKNLETNGTILVVYSNPNFLIEKIKKILKKILKLSNKKNPEFTFERFTITEIKLALPKAELIPFRFLSGEDMRRILPNNNLTRFLLKFIIFIEPFLPLFLVQYYLIRLKDSRN